MDVSVAVLVGKEICTHYQELFFRIHCHDEHVTRRAGMILGKLRILS